MFEGELYVGGAFSNIDGDFDLDNFVKWKNNSWHKIDNFRGSSINRLKVIDDTLYALGYRQMHITANDTIDGVARLNTSTNTWESLYDFDELFDDDGLAFVNDITKYRGNWVVCGNFYSPTYALQDFAIYKDGVWQDMGGATKSGLEAIWQAQVFQDKLYITGKFSKAAGNVANGLKVWDGEKWYEPSGGLQKTPWSEAEVQVHRMHLYKNELYFLGSFQHAGGDFPAFRFVKYDGTNWYNYNTDTSEVPYFDRPITIEFLNDELYLYTALEGTSFNGSRGFVLKAKDSFVPIDSANFVSTSQEVLKPIEVQVYPNPSMDNMTIVLEENTIKAQLLNLEGKVVLELQLKKGNNTIDVSALPKGVYLLIGSSQNTGFRKRIVKL